MVVKSTLQTKTLQGLQGTPSKSIITGKTLVSLYTPVVHCMELQCIPVMGTRFSLLANSQREKLFSLQGWVCSDTINI